MVVSDNNCLAHNFWCSGYSLSGMGAIYHASRRPSRAIISLAFREESCMDRNALVSTTADIIFKAVTKPIKYILFAGTAVRSPCCDHSSEA